MNPAVVLVVAIIAVTIITIIAAEAYHDHVDDREQRSDVHQFVADFIPEVNRPDIHCTCPPQYTAAGEYMAGCPLHEGGNVR